jgi:hypothetical protein
MIRHIVLFKMKDEFKDEQNQKKLASALAALKDTTDGYMTECETALDVVHAHNSYDVVLNSVFKSVEDVKKYAVHPEHVKILAYIKEVCVSTTKIDCEI